jgi:outer membrane lipoprotein-sorting protein
MNKGTGPPGKKPVVVEARSGYNISTFYARRVSMKKTFAVGLTVVLLAGLAVQAGAQDAKSVLAKMIEAQGGAAALKAVQTSTISGTIEIVQQGLSGSLTMYQKEPNKMRMDIEIMGMIITNATDGEKAWMVNPQSGVAEEMNEAQAKSMRLQAMGSDALFNPEKVGLTYTLKGQEKIGGKDYILLEQSFKEGQIILMYIDAATYLPFKTKTKAPDPMGGGDVDSESFFDDYRKEGDTMAAHKLTIFQNGAEAVRMIFSKIVYNAPIEDSLFKMPK